MSKVSSSRLRKALFMPVICATRYNPVLRKFFENLRQRGKSKMAAVGAVMRKQNQRHKRDAANEEILKGYLVFGKIA